MGILLLSELDVGGISIGNVMIYCMEGGLQLTCEGSNCVYE